MEVAGEVDELDNCDRGDTAPNQRLVLENSGALYEHEPDGKQAENEGLVLP